MKLSFEYNLIPYPHKEALSLDGKWSVLILKIVDSSNTVVKTIFELQWNIIVFLEWFIENKNFILDEFLFFNVNEKSIAESIHDFYENIDDNMIEHHGGMIDMMFEYRTRHDIRFALRGTDVESIIIGVRNDNYTISLYNEIEKWEYNIDLSEFYETIEKAYAKFSSNTNHPKG